VKREQGYAQDVGLTALQVLKLCGVCGDLQPGGWCRHRRMMRLDNGRVRAAGIAELKRCPLGRWEVLEADGVRLISGCS